MVKFPYPVKFVANNKKEFSVRVTKPTKRSWWIELTDSQGNKGKVIKVNKASTKLYYPNEKGGFVNGPSMVKVLLKQRNSEPPTSVRQTSSKSTTNRQ